MRYVEAYERYASAFKLPEPWSTGGQARLRTQFGHGTASK